MVINYKTYSSYFKYSALLGIPALQEVSGMKARWI